MCISNASAMGQSTASSSKKKNKRAMVNDTEGVVSTKPKKMATLSSTSGMNTANSTGRLNIT